SIFHHFKNKDEILFTVMSEVVVEMTEELKLLLEQAPTLKLQLRAVIYNELKFIHGETSDATTVLIHEWRSLSEERQQQIMKMRGAYECYWLNIFEAVAKE